MNDQKTLPSIFGRDRAVLDKLANRIYRGIRGADVEVNNMIEQRRGSTFDMATTIDGDRFVARVTIELLPRNNGKDGNAKEQTPTD